MSTEYCLNCGGYHELTTAGCVMNRFTPGTVYRVNVPIPEAASPICDKCGQVIGSPYGCHCPSPKGICAHCHKPVEVRSGEAWHTKGEKVWHEVCSYQEQLEKSGQALIVIRNAVRLAEQTGDSAGALRVIKEAIGE